MVVHRDPQGTARLHHLFRHVDISDGWRWITRRVVVQEPTKIVKSLKIIDK
jgi:hypothetical protein